MPNKFSRLTFFSSLSLLLLSMVLGGCGIKPQTLDAPPGSENIVFPQTYPAPDEDRP